MQEYHHATMNLPLLMPDIPGQRFDCRGCTRCCRDLVVHLTRLDRDKIDRQDWSGKLTGSAYVRLGREYVLNHGPDGGCVFLRQDGKCRIHAEFGGGAKPLACQLYPFTLEPDSSALRVGIRFDCPTVARSEGSALVSHRSLLTALAADLQTQMPGHFRPNDNVCRITAARALSPKELNAVVGCLDHWIADASRPLMYRLIGLSSFIETLTVAKLDRLDESRFIELLNLVASDLANVVADPLPTPTARQKALLRQAVFAHSEHISIGQARAPFLKSLSHRFNQLARARRFAAAERSIPTLGCSPTKSGEIAGATVDALRASPSLSVTAVDELLTRYLRSRIVNRSFFGHAYYHWPILDGLASLILATAVVGWLCRYFAVAAGRDSFESSDIIAAVGVVDRAAGRARELGARSAKLRVAYLRQDAGLLRLITAYPIMES